MAGDWIKMRSALIGEREVVAIACELQVEEDLVLGKLFRLWEWADRHTTDGRIEQIPMVWIDTFLDRQGFANSLVKVGWLKAIDGGGFAFPRWDRHNSKSAKQRALDAARKGRTRSGQKPDINRDSSTVVSISSSSSLRMEEVQEGEGATPSVLERLCDEFHFGTHKARELYDRWQYEHADLDAWLQYEAGKGTRLRNHLMKSAKNPRDVQGFDGPKSQADRDREALDNFDWKAFREAK